MQVPALGSFYYEQQPQNMSLFSPERRTPQTLLHIANILRLQLGVCSSVKIHSRLFACPCWTLSGPS